MFELTDPAFAQAIRDLGYGEIRYVDSGPWYTKAECEQLLEDPNVGVEEKMCIRWALDEMAREEAEEAEQAEREKVNAQGSLHDDNDEEEAKTKEGVEEEKEKEEVQDEVKDGEEGCGERPYDCQPTSSPKEMKQGS